MELFFITSNNSKFAEAQTILPSIKRLELDLEEIQELDPKRIIIAKVKAAREHQKNNFVVEDVSLSIECLNGFPGPLTKWFEVGVGIANVADLVMKYENHNATASTTVGYVTTEGETHFFEGSIAGTIVAPRGDNGFGFDVIFQPHGTTKTFAELSLAEKAAFSHRAIAFTKLKEYLNTQA